MNPTNNLSNNQNCLISQNNLKGYILQKQGEFVQIPRKAKFLYLSQIIGVILITLIFGSLLINELLGGGIIGFIISSIVSIVICIFALNKKFLLPKEKRYTVDLGIQSSRKYFFHNFVRNNHMPLYDSIMSGFQIQTCTLLERIFIQERQYINRKLYIHIKRIKY